MTEEKLNELLRDMSLQEKIDQLLQLSSSFYSEDAVMTGPAAELGITEEDINGAGSILGGIGAATLKQIQKKYMEKQPHHIPMLFMADIINGYRTTYPIPLAQGCTFSPELAKKGARLAAREAAAAGLHVTFSPMVDLVRDPRWGRVMESTGEDPYLNSRFAEAMVQGYQGNALSEKGSIAACVKHFAGYGAPTAGREYNNVELSERTLREDYLPAYEAGIKAGSALVMTSFNTLNRIPSSANRWLLRDVLRKEMGFDGVLISDWAAIEELVYHGIAADKEEAAKLAIEAGVDIDMMTGVYAGQLEKLVRSGKVKEEQIDEAVLRVLQLKNRLGLFENPYKDADEEKEKELILCQDHTETARKIAEESFVLLKNDGILPLSKEKASYVFIGPHTDNPRIYGSWSIFARPWSTATLRDGVERLLAAEKERGVKDLCRVTFANGSPLVDENTVLEGFGNEALPQMEASVREREERNALTFAACADVVVMAIGEHRLQSGESTSRAELTIPRVQLELFRRVRAVNPNIVVVLFNGRPLDIKELKEKARAVLEVWWPGCEGGTAIARTLFGMVNPSGKLAMSFPYCVGQIPVFYNEFSTGRPDVPGKNKDRFRSKYIDISNKPLYPFGYGLSYTTFSYSEVRLDKTAIKPDESLTASVMVTNTGERTGKETVQLYLRDVAGSVVRPVRELKGFEKIELAPGESKTVSFVITEEMLRFYGADMRYQSEPGEFVVYIGGDSETENKAEFVLLETEDACGI